MPLILIKSTEYIPFTTNNSIFFHKMAPLKSIILLNDTKPILIISKIVGKIYRLSSFYGTI